MHQRQHRSACEHPGEHDNCRTRCVDRLTGRPGQIDTSVARIPVRSGSVEPSHHSWRGLQRPTQSDGIGMDRADAKGTGGSNDRQRAHNSHGCTSGHLSEVHQARQRGFVDLSAAVDCGGSSTPCHGVNFRLRLALRELTSRVCTHTGCQRSLSDFRRGSAFLRAPGLGFTRNRAPTDNKRNSRTWLL